MQLLGKEKRKVWSSYLTGHIITLSFSLINWWVAFEFLLPATELIEFLKNFYNSANIIDCFQRAMPNPSSGCQTQCRWEPSLSSLLSDCKSWRNLVSREGDMGDSLPKILHNLISEKYISLSVNGITQFCRHTDLKCTSFFILDYICVGGKQFFKVMRGNGS